MGNWWGVLWLAALVQVEWARPFQQELVSLKGRLREGSGTVRSIHNYRCTCTWELRNMKSSMTLPGTLNLSLVVAVAPKQHHMTNNSRLRRSTNILP